MDSVDVELYAIESNLNVYRKEIKKIRSISAEYIIMKIPQNLQQKRDRNAYYIRTVMRELEQTEIQHRSMLQNIQIHRNRCSGFGEIVCYRLSFGKSFSIMKRPRVGRRRNRDDSPELLKSLRNGKKLFIFFYM